WAKFVGAPRTSLVVTPAPRRRAVNATCAASGDVARLRPPSRSPPKSRAHGRAGQRCSSGGFCAAARVAGGNASSRAEVEAGMTTIGIIGAGNIGSNVARAAIRSGYDVVIANSRGPETLTDLVG